MTYIKNKDDLLKSNEEIEKLIAKKEFIEAGEFNISPENRLCSWNECGERPTKIVKLPTGFDEEYCEDHYELFLKSLL